MLLFYSARPEMGFTLRFFALGSGFATQLSKESGVQAEAFGSLSDQCCALLFAQGSVVQQFAVTILEDFGLGQFGEAVHAQCILVDTVVACHQGCHCLTAREVAQVAQVVVC